MQKLLKANSYSLKNGFTIVEMIIVVVVIAILAMLTVVAYRTVQQDARRTALQSDLKNTADKLTVYYTTNKGRYPSTLEAENTVKTGENELTYTRTATGFCLTGRLPSSGITYNITHEGSVQEGECVVDTIQSFTAADCTALPVYTGTNTEAIRSVADTRGGTTQTYEIAKLADNKCWMLTNLKLGSTSGSITLTPDDSDIGSSFTLPQVDTTGVSTETPYVYGPVTGDTGSGATNYGYLYNFPAAIAGTSLPAGTGTAQYSICPKKWRLPTGRDAVGDFALLNAKMNNPGATTGSTSTGAGYYEGWQYTGPFKGVPSGYRSSGGFYSQGGSGFFWTASASSSATYAYNAYFSSSFIDPGTNINYSYRENGFAIRCVLR